MTRPSIPVTRVHHVDDMLGIIPHLLGFHPSESVVLVAVVDGIVELTARADLEDLLPAGHVELLIGRVLARFPQSLVWIVGYASDESSCTEVLIRGRDHLQGNLAFEPICVSGGRYRVGDWAEWFPYDPAATTSAAEATVHGLQARRSRSELSRGLRADPRHRSQVEDAYADACLRYQRVSSEDRPAALLAAIHAGLHDPEALDPRELAWLGALINDPYARDAAVLSLETFAASAWVRLWSRVVQKLSPRHPAAAVGDSRSGRLGERRRRPAIGVPGGVGRAGTRARTEAAAGEHQRRRPATERVARAAGAAADAVGGGRRRGRRRAR